MQKKPGGKEEEEEEEGEGRCRLCVMTTLSRTNCINYAREEEEVEEKEEEKEEEEEEEDQVSHLLGKTNTKRINTKAF